VLILYLLTGLMIGYQPGILSQSVDDETVFEWQTRALEESGLSPDSFGAFEADWETLFRGVTGLVVVYDDAIIYEAYNRQTPDALMSVYSVTKSIGAILTGIAIEDGYVDNYIIPMLEARNDLEQ